MKKIILMMVLLGMIFNSYATHNRAGEIIYKHIQGLTYEITIITYTKASSHEADRPDLILNFGDGQKIKILRTYTQFRANDVRYNEYKTKHTYIGPGSYILSMEDPNRNAGIVNIPNSVLTPFYIQSELIIPTFGSIGENSSANLLNPPIDDGCIDAIYEHNPGADDPDGDSLRYYLTECLGYDGEFIFGYRFPDKIIPSAKNNISIDSVTGTITWNSPKTTGEYNIAFIIEEWRRIDKETYVKTGYITRDMQITINECENKPPIIQLNEKDCIEAEKTYSQRIIAKDTNVENMVTLTATGGGLEVDNSPAVFSQPVRGLNYISSVFYWNVKCEHVRLYPYYTLFRAEDGKASAVFKPLVDYKTLSLKVIAPSPKNLVLSFENNKIKINWTPSICQEGTIGYSLFRRIDTSGYKPKKCQTGLPDDIGYNKIATIDDIRTDIFLDNGNNDLISGHKYCYIMYSNYKDGSESYASEEICIDYIWENVIILKSSVILTDKINGKVKIGWTNRFINSNLWTFPFNYEIFRKISSEENFTKIYSSTEVLQFENLDSIFIDSNINTQELNYQYKIEIQSSNNGNLIGKTENASTPFLTLTPYDNQIKLKWETDVPWLNKHYEIQKEIFPGGNVFKILDTTDLNYYTDKELKNGKEYCYRVRTIGNYSAFNDTILNYSQKICGIPIDLQPPCPPQLELQDNCKESKIILKWTNPNVVCDTVDDVMNYIIYFKNSLDGEYQKFKEITNANQLEYKAENLQSLAGCYYITAIDSSMNESDKSNEICIDNCPIYKLPNIFTPDGDGKNDVFVSFPYRYIDKVDMKIYNRWGQLVFETTNPHINWTGQDMKTKKIVLDGVYFYVCTVYELRLIGIVKKEISGSITVLGKEKLIIEN